MGLGRQSDEGEQGQHGEAHAVRSRGRYHGMGIAEPVTRYLAAREEHKLE